MLTSIQGFPRIGARRELKFALEAFWRGESGKSELDKTARALRLENYLFLKSAGQDLVPVGDFSFYDKMLDTCSMVGAVPARFALGQGELSLEEYFTLARGAERDKGNIHPLSMLKWFNTNYHYLVPEFDPDMQFSFRDRSILSLVDEALETGAAAMPVLIGPVSFLLLGRCTEDFDPLSLLDSLLPVYTEVLEALASKGVEWIQVDEPCFAGEVNNAARESLGRACTALEAACGGSAKIVVQTYFDHVGGNFRTLTGLPAAGLGLDFVHGEENLDLIREHGFPAGKTLFAGVLDGRNIWACDPESVLSLVERLKTLIGGEKLVLSTSCSLMHVPVTVESETHLPPEVLSSMSFAREKVRELAALARTASGSGQTREDRDILDRAHRAADQTKRSPLKKVPSVRKRLASLTRRDFHRSADYQARQAAQAKALKLPLFPTTTIGSFPQTTDLRRLRASLRKGELSEDEYQQAIKDNILSLVKLQEELGLDVLVHGEFERSDMVEYFGERLEGYYFLRNGWVLSYGSRCVKPPVIYGDVYRQGPMTVLWSKLAQSLTSCPMKGILTGPVTMLNWSFVRDDIPREEVCLQLALAIRDEVADLEKAGIKVIQIDEPALREGLPLQPGKQSDYLRWAVDAFRLASSGSALRTQIHSHMCYSDFNTIIDHIIRMDADVISIENSRAGGRLLQVFKEKEYPNGIGPGVWDIHSPLVPSQEEIERHLREIIELLPADKVWVNPDCGLKTRGWEEVKASLQHMVSAARTLRLELK